MSAISVEFGSARFSEDRRWPAPRVFVIGFYLPGRYEALAAAPPTRRPSALNAWIHIGTDDAVTIMIDKSEMGQGDHDFALHARCRGTRVRLEEGARRVCSGGEGLLQPGIRFAGHRRQLEHPFFLGANAQGRRDRPRNADRGGRAEVGRRQIAMPRREQHGDPHAHEAHASATGALRKPPRRLPVPADVPLKNPKDFEIVGKPVKRLDTADKVNGSAEFGIDMKRPGMLYATVVRCPVFGGKVESFDAAKAKKCRGVKDVVQISSGVAVVADNTWSALQGRKALEIKWNEGPNATVSSDGIWTLFAERADQSGRCRGPKRR